MTKILFVCHGNICRSTMAEFVLKDLVAKAGLAGNFSIASAACRRDEIGSDIHPGTKAKLTEKGIPFASRRAVLFTRADYDSYDHILAMDEENMRDLARCTKDDPQHKIRLLLSVAGEERDIADPWYTGNFEATYQDVLKGCTALVTEIVPDGT